MFPFEIPSGVFRLDNKPCQLTELINTTKRSVTGRLNEIYQISGKIRLPRKSPKMVAKKEPEFKFSKNKLTVKESQRRSIIKTAKVDEMIRKVSSDSFVFSRNTSFSGILTNDSSFLTALKKSKKEENSAIKLKRQLLKDVRLIDEDRKVKEISKLNIQPNKNLREW